MDASGITLFVLGGIAYNYKTWFQAPCHTEKYPIEIPSLHVTGRMTMAGFLPSSAMSVELGYILRVCGITNHISTTTFRLYFLLILSL